MRTRKHTNAVEKDQYIILIDNGDKDVIVVWGTREQAFEAMSEWYRENDRFEFHQAEIIDSENNTVFKNYFGQNN